MEYKRFINLMNEPHKAGAETVSSLQELLKEFPYFQSAQLLLARSMNEQQHIRFERQLKLAAAYAPDRKKLFALIHSQKVKSVDLSVNHEEDIVSPFVLEEKKTPVIEIEKADTVQNENPFSLSSNVSVEPIVSEKPTEEKFIPAFEEEKHYEPRYAVEAEEITAADPIIQNSSMGRTEEPLSSDPREVLRRRLAEILGNPEEEQTAAEIPDDEKTFTRTVILPPEEEKPALNMESQVKVEQAPDSITMPSEILLDTLSSIPEPPVPEPKVRDALEDLLPEDSSKPMDAIDKLGLEYAIEETFLSSLEKLPPIESEEEDVSESLLSSKTVPPPKEDIDSFIDEETNHELAAKLSEKRNTHSFSTWLIKLSGSEYGKVEEVHADDTLSGSTKELPDTDKLHTSNEKTVKAETEVEELQALKATEAPNKVDNSAKKELIDKFIATEPKITPSKAEFYSPVTQAKRSIEEYDDVVSETLARIYKAQGNNLKARFCYEKLSLFYPEKRTYFAALIKEIDTELNSSNQEDL